MLDNSSRSDADKADDPSSLDGAIAFSIRELTYSTWGFSGWWEASKLINACRYTSKNQQTTWKNLTSPQILHLIRVKKIEGVDPHCNKQMYEMISYCMSYVNRN